MCTPETPRPAPPRFGSYRVFLELGSGAMGTVYHGFDDCLGRDVAIKMLDPYAPARLVARFDKEVRVLASLSHPNIPFVIERGYTSDDVPYYVMEYLPGVDLWRLVRHDGPQPVGRVIHVLMQLASALRETHDAGVMHRDVKPSNVMLCMQSGAPDLVKLIDFGLASELESVNLTPGTRRCGTPGFMAPEIFTDDDSLIDHRSDLYGFGAVGYFLLTGLSPAAGDEAEATPIDFACLLESPTTAALAGVLQRCMSSDPEQRPSSARAVLEELAPLAQTSPWTARFAETWWRQTMGYSHTDHDDDTLDEAQSWITSEIAHPMSWRRLSSRLPSARR